MGRNKYNAPLDKAERKRVKNGASVDWDLERRPKGVQQYNWSINHTENTTDTRRGGLAKRRGPRHSQTSDNSWVHAILFCVLLAIVVSWALGY